MFKFSQLNYNKKTSVFQEIFWKIGGFYEKKEIANLAGYILEPEYKPTNSLVKSVAGSALKCCGHKGVPHAEIIEKATMISYAGSKIYKKMEVKLANEILKKYA